MTRNKAVALEYEGVNELPKVVASGVGEVARQIIQLAEAHDIPIHHNTELTDLLSKIPAGTDITPETFRLVAEVLCFLNFADGEWAKRALPGSMLPADASES